MKKSVLYSYLFFFCTNLCFSQNITTAASFFSSVSDRYAKISDYSVDISITLNNSVQSGTAIFKRPDMLRIDFKYPADQCIIFTGEVLSIYLPQYGIILNQDVEQSSAGGASLATPQGLSLMKRAYTIQYETSSAPVRLSEDSSEMVNVLILNRKYVSETFKTLRMMILPESKLIRRIEAVPISGGKITFDFYNYRINTGIAGRAFLFDMPPSAKVLNNFLFAD